MSNIGGGIQISKTIILLNSCSGLAVRILNITVMVWMYQYLLTRIGPAEYSIYPVVMAGMAFAPVVTTVLTSGIGRFVAGAYARGDEAEVTEVVSTMMPILLAAAALVAAGGVVVAFNVDSFLNVAPQMKRDAGIMTSLLFAIVAFRIACAPLGLGLYATQKFFIDDLLTLGGELLRLSVLFILLVTLGAKVMWVVVASVSSEAVRLLARQIISRRLAPALKFDPRRVRWGKCKEILNFGAWGTCLRLAEAIRTSIDPLLLNRMGTAYDVTCFDLGSMPNRQIQSGISSMRATLDPALTAMHETNDGRISATYLRGGRYGLWLALFPAAVLFVHHVLIVELYIGPEYAPAGPIAALLMGVLAIAYGNMMMPHLAQARGRMREWAWRALVLQGANLALTYLFVVSLGFGAFGAALGTVVAYAFGEALLYLPLGLRLAGVSLPVWLKETFIPGLLPCVVATCGMYAAKRISAPESWLSLLPQLAVGAVVYIVTLASLGMRRADRRDATEVVRRITSKLGLQGNLRSC